MEFPPFLHVNFFPFFCSSVLKSHFSFRDHQFHPRSIAGGPFVAVWGGYNRWIRTEHWSEGGFPLRKYISRDIRRLNDLLNKYLDSSTHVQSIILGLSFDLHSFRVLISTPRHVGPWRAFFFFFRTTFVLCAIVSFWQLQQPEVASTPSWDIKYIDVVFDVMHGCPRLTSHLDSLSMGRTNRTGIRAKNRRGGRTSNMKLGQVVRDFLPPSLRKTAVINDCLYDETASVD